MTPARWSILPTARTPVAVLGRFAKRKPVGAVGGLLVLVLVVVAVLAPFIAPFDPNQGDYDRLLKAPSPQHLMGTDNFGRDMLSRVLYGARISLYIGIGAVVLGTTTGSLLGLVGAYFGGKTDMAIQRVMDAQMSIPTLILAMAVVAALGTSLINVVIAIAVSIIPGASRVVRSWALSVRQSDYISAARALGAGHLRILVRHMMPNCTAPYIIIASVALGNAILTESSLSFLGLGPPPPTPTWGSMLSGAAERFARTAPWLPIFPGLAISLAVFGFNLLGDALRDVLDPRLRVGSR